MIDFELEPTHSHQIARIKVLGIGGAGGNTVNHMINAQYENVEFLVANTDAQALKVSTAPMKIQIGQRATRGLGAGANPEIGKKAAEEDLDKIIEFLRGADIVFLSAGLGGGTGSGALPVIAKAIKEMGEALCIAVVTKPFTFEGKRRMAIAEKTIEQVRNDVDTLIVIPNQKLIEYADKSVSLVGAFDMINDVMHQFVKSISDIIARPGHINVDFADICTIMKSMGVAVMGTGRASGVDRAQKAAYEAISSPLLENISIQGARAVLLNITGSSQLGLHEVHMAAQIIYDQVHPDANIIIGSVIDEAMGDDVIVTIIATGVEHHDAQHRDTVALVPAHATEEHKEEIKVQEEQDVEKREVEKPHDSLPLDMNDLEVPTYMRRMKEHTKED